MNKHSISSVTSKVLSEHEHRPKENVIRQRSAVGESSMTLKRNKTSEGAVQQRDVHRQNTVHGR